MERRAASRAQDHSPHEAVDSTHRSRRSETGHLQLLLQPHVIKRYAFTMTPTNTSRPSIRRRRAHNHNADNGWMREDETDMSSDYRAFVMVSCQTPWPDPINRYRGAEGSVNPVDRGDSSAALQSSRFG
ncbi:hypothetical protein E8E13_007136 [Curvularia kusanoi]|uniref:Uncharacterized protein n=1 Tax=Curvularia kusanoi TaxID=90978 RepID=A0A9P4TB28_CURKU|nr:hypothetical protein E8E13_007136 [Curvularia kusanoi]